jgi:hypothetical protein
MPTTVSAGTRLVGMAKSFEVSPSRNRTSAGSVTTPSGYTFGNVIAIPEAGAGPERVRVPVVGEPATTGFGFRLKFWRSGRLSDAAFPLRSNQAWPSYSV